METEVQCPARRASRRRAGGVAGGEPAITKGAAPGGAAAGHSKKNLGHNLRTTRQRFERIKVMNEEYSIEQLCVTLAVTRSGYLCQNQRRLPLGGGGFRPLPPPDRVWIELLPQEYYFPAAAYITDSPPDQNTTYTYTIFAFSKTGQASYPIVLNAKLGETNEVFHTYLQSE